MNSFWDYADGEILTHRRVGAGITAAVKVTYDGNEYVDEVRLLSNRSRKAFIKICPCSQGDSTESWEIHKWLQAEGLRLLSESEDKKKKERSEDDE